MINEALFDRINSATKYPSIPTFHTLGEKGRFVAPNDHLPLPEDQLFITEKIDGTNARIIIIEDDDVFMRDYLIGSREELLYAYGDRIGNPSQGIVRHVKPVISKTLMQSVLDGHKMAVIYMEVYGGKIQNSKNYTKKEAVSFRVFDIARFNYDIWDKLMNMEASEIAAWRDSGGQAFLSAQELKTFPELCWDMLLVPQLEVSEKPNVDSFEDVMKWLTKLCPKTKAAIDGEPGKAEGVVIRSADRKFIAKLRFEDYQKSMRK